MHQISPCQPPYDRLHRISSTQALEHNARDGKATQGRTERLHSPFPFEHAPKAARQEQELRFEYAAKNRDEMRKFQKMGITHL